LTISVKAARFRGFEADVPAGQTTLKHLQSNHLVDQTATAELGGIGVAAVLRVTAGN
jgi:hypothetical protein